MLEQVRPIGFVQSSRAQPQNDFWGSKEACIALTEPFTAEALQGITDFSHAEIIYLFHQVRASKIVTAARHPRDNQAWPKVGIFAQRGKDRPNRIGCTICKLVRQEGAKLFVSGLDAVNATPVLDIKAVMAEFPPREEVRQPAWSRELIRDYWQAKS